MDIKINWHQHMPLENGDEDNLIYDVRDIQEWDECPGVYIFARKYGGSIYPLYIGRSKDVGRRIREHLNTTKMMR